MLENSYHLFFVTIIVHLVLFIFDDLMKRWRVCWYLTFQKRYGINLQLFIIKWFTTIFNRCIQKVGNWRPKFQKIWFSFGMWIALFSLPFATYFLIQSTCILFINLFWNENKSDKTVIPFLQPAVPGINIPFSDFGYYISTLLLCSVFHELGHAMAAVREGIHISGIGIFIMLIIPVAYVRMEGLENLALDKQLRVLCAGVWHNIILAFAAFVLIFVLPWICLFYENGSGVQVVTIHKNSPLLQEGGLKIDDIIYSINDCSIFEQKTWIKCLYREVKNPVLGYCISSEFVHENDESTRIQQVQNVVECCDNDTLSKICFEYLEKVDIPLELPQYSCLKARAVIEHSKGICYSANDCSSSHCFRPCLPNGTKLIEMKLKNQNNVLFLGHPIEVLHGVHTSEFIKTTFLSSAIPDGINKFCNFIIMFSGALATLNLIPCFHFDGEHITRVLLNVSLSKNVRLKSIRFAISLSITILGSCILVVYSVCIIFSVILKKIY